MGVACWVGVACLGSKVILPPHTQALHQSIPGQEELGSQLVSLGKTLLSTMEEGSPAEQYVDGQLSDVEGRLADLVTPHSGSIDTRETAVNKVRLQPVLAKL